MAARYRVNLNKLTVEQRKEKLDELKLELSALKEKGVSVFAMKSGQQYAGKEVWDCGRK
jgi:ribosomal protein L29